MEQRKGEVLAWVSLWVVKESRKFLRQAVIVYNALVVPVLLYGAETCRTLTKSDEHKNKLESFQVSCLRWILGIRWFDFFAKRISDEPDVVRSDASAAEAVTDVTYFNICLQWPVPTHEALRLQVTDLQTARNTNLHEVVPDKHGSASWRSISGSLQII